MPPLEEDEYEIPLRDQRYFGSGLKRKRIQFVPSSSSSTAESARSSHHPAGPSGAERYRKIVLQKKKDVPAETAASQSPAETPPLIHQPETPSIPPDLNNAAQAEDTITCSICHHPIHPADSTTASTSHQSSIVHQICIQHSHPPSHLDRRRKGLALLASQGWDPDDRKGLGVKGEGVLYPIKARENPTRAGLGVRLRPERVVQRVEKLDAGRVRRMEAEGKKKAGRLRESFYRSEDVVRYLGE